MTPGDHKSKMAQVPNRWQVMDSRFPNPVFAVRFGRDVNRASARSLEYLEANYGPEAAEEIQSIVMRIDTQDPGYYQLMFSDPDPATEEPPLRLIYALRVMMHANSLPEAWFQSELDHYLMMDGENEDGITLGSEDTASEVSDDSAMDEDYEPEEDDSEDDTDSTCSDHTVIDLTG